MKRLFSVVAGCGLAILLGASASAQDSKSSPLARELSGLMVGQNLSAVAARDPDTPDRFVAALLFPDVQLLVVAAQYAAPAVLQDQLSRKQYADMYATLQGAVLQESKVFFQDLKADGLHEKPGSALDIMYERVVNQTFFDGNSGKQKLAATEYARKFAAADELYSRLLTLLIGELKGSPSTR